MSVAGTPLVIVIRAYQLIFRPVLGANCRFTPSCSDYAIQALRSHGALRGTALTVGRILRCNPWHQGGHDPVPPCQNHAPALSKTKAS